MDSLNKRATELITEAVKYDEDNKFPEAIRKYKEGSELLLQSIKFEKNPYVIQNVRKKVTEYLDRIDKLRERVKADEEDKKKKPEKEGKSGGKANKKDKDENQELKDGLSKAIVSEKPNIKWSDVAGLKSAKADLQATVILPIRHPTFFTGKVKPWAGILLYGPPGTGKSYLAKAVATETSGTFFSVSSSDLVSKWQGESAKLVRSLFEMAREKKPSIVFIDEIDSLCQSRDQGSAGAGAQQVLTEFLVQMDGVGKDQSGVLVLGATNTPWSLDSAIRRRFQKRIYIPLPDEEARKTMLKIHFGKDNHDLTDADFAQLAKMCDGYSGSDMSTLAKQALMLPITKMQRATHFLFTVDPSGKRKFQPCHADDLGAIECTIFDIEEGAVDLPRVSFQDVMSMMKKAVKSVSKGELKRYDDWTAEFGEEGV